MDPNFDRALQRIPPQLRDSAFRFVPILNGRKRPEGKRWSTDANYPFGHAVLAGYLAEGHNYGVLTGVGGLVVLDVDDLDRLQALGIIDRLPETFAVRTGRGGLHFYFACLGLQDKIILEDPELKDTDGDPLHLGELQALGQQVVGPGSIHPNGNRYEIVKDVPIAAITKGDLLQILAPLEQTIETEAEHAQKARTHRSGGSSLGDLIPIDQAAWPKDIKERAGSEVRGTHPLHGSTSGKNFAVNTSKNCWHCFRHKSGGGPLEWLAVEAGLIGCKEAKPGCLDDKELFKKVLQIAQDRGFDIPAPTGARDGKQHQEQEHEPGKDERVGEYRLASILAGHFTGELRWANHRGDWMAYKQGCWVAVSEQEILKQASDILHAHFVSKLADAISKREIREITSEIYKANTINVVRNALTFVKGWPGIATYADEWDTYPWLLNVRNGTLDLKTGEFRPHNPADLLTARAEVDFDPSAICPKWEKHIQTVLPVPNVRRQVQRDLGRALVGAVLEESLPIWHGSGANGRSTTTRTLMTILGSYTRRAAPNLLIQSKYDRHPAEIADLVGSRLVFSIEVEEGKRLAEVLVKEMTGGDKKKARFMRQNFFEFEQTFDIFLIVNHKPVIKGTDEGIWRRVRLVPWDHTIPREARRPQEEVVQELLQERSGILNWLLAGLRDWQADHLWIAPEVRAATDNYRFEMDTLKPFIDDYCILKPHLSVPVADLYAAYSGYCVLASETPLTKRDFARKIRDRGITSQKGAKGQMAFYGIGLKTQKPASSDQKVDEGGRVSSSPHGNFTREGDMETRQPSSTQNDFSTSVDSKFCDNNAKKQPFEVDEAQSKEIGNSQQSAQACGMGPHPRRDEPAPTNDPEFRKFKEGMVKRRCCLCGRTFPYDLTPYVGQGGKHGYICSTCHMHGPPPEPAKADPQTRLEGEA